MGIQFWRVPSFILSIEIIFILILSFIILYFFKIDFFLLKNPLISSFTTLFILIVSYYLNKEKYLSSYILKLINISSLFLFFTSIFLFHINEKEIKTTKFYIVKKIGKNSFIIKTKDRKTFLLKTKRKLSKESIYLSKLKLKPIDYPLSFKFYLFSNKIFYSAYPIYVKKVGKKPETFQEKIRSFILKNSKKYLNKYGFMFFSSLILGKREFLDKDYKEKIKSLGIMHLFAISGLHIGIITFLILYFVEKLPFFPKTRLFIFSFLLVLYGFIVGAQSSVVRSIIMFILLFSKKMLGKVQDSFNLLFISFIISLVFYPFYIFSIGFYFSYLATFAILIFISFVKEENKEEQKLFNKISNYISDSFRISTFTILYTSIVSLYFFNTLNILTIITTFILSPLIFIIVSLSFIFLIFLFIPFSSFFLKIVAFFINISSFLTLKLSEILYNIFDYNLIFLPVLDKTLVIFIFFILIFFTLYIVLKKLIFLLFNILTYIILLLYIVFILPHIFFIYKTPDYLIISNSYKTIILKEHPKVFIPPFFSGTSTEIFYINKEKNIIIESKYIPKTKILNNFSIIEIKGKKFKLENFKILRSFIF